MMIKPMNFSKTNKKELTMNRTNRKWKRRKRMARKIRSGYCIVKVWLRNYVLRSGILEEK